jgi:hypothetical protein
MGHSPMVTVWRATRQTKPYGPKLRRCREVGAGVQLDSVAGNSGGSLLRRSRPIDTWCRLVQSGAMSTKTSTPSIRLTIPVSPETHAVFARMSEAFGRPVGRLMGEWLNDHRQAAEEVCRVVEGVRGVTGSVSSLGLLASAYADQAQVVIDSAKGGGAAARASAALDVSAAPVSARKSARKPLTPPVGNTGGKVSGARTPKGSK